MNDPRSIAENPVIRKIYRHDSEPGSLHVEVADSTGQEVVIAIGADNALYDILHERLVAFDERITEVRSAQQGI